MATTVYQNKIVKLIDGTELEIMPLKIKYLREFMEEFEHVKKAKNACLLRILSRIQK